MTTEVLIVGPEAGYVAILNEWIDGRKSLGVPRMQHFERIEMKRAGGSMHFTSPVWAAAFGQLPEGLLDKLHDERTWGLKPVSVILNKEGLPIETFIVTES